jgi:hypothetical protein
MTATQVMNRTAAVALSLLVALGACRTEPTAVEKTPPTEAPAKLTDLSASIEPVRIEFNARKSELRFLTILSPTCGACLHGARAVKQTIVDNPTTKSLLEIVVWIRMLEEDSLAAAGEASLLFRDAPISQFWDARQQLGKDVAVSIGVPKRIAWDIYLFYPRSVEWPTIGGPPPPEVAVAQMGGMVVATKGTLRPLADQTRLPKDMTDKADVVGEQWNLETLLTQVAEAFVRRHSNSQ